MHSFTSSLTRLPFSPIIQLRSSSPRYFQGSATNVRGLHLKVRLGAGGVTSDILEGLEAAVEGLNAAAVGDFALHQTAGGYEESLRFAMEFYA